jgi:hypothetical protein
MSTPPPAAPTPPTRELPSHNPLAKTGPDNVPICDECEKPCVYGWSTRGGKKGSGVFCGDCSEE